MSTGQMLYLVLVIAAFAIFALVLAGASWYETSGRRTATSGAPGALPQQVLGAGEGLRRIAA